MMLPDSIELEVVTPERQVVKETVSEVQLPALAGYLGVLPGHAPLVTELGVGELSYRKGKDTSQDRKSTRLNSSHSQISYAVFCLKKKKKRGGNQRFELLVSLRRLHVR